MNRRTFLKQLVGFSLTVIGLGGGTFYYSREIEPASLHIQQEIIKSNRIAPPFHNKKIIQFSDTHLGFHYSVEDLKELVQTINEREPDIVVFTGDLVDDPLELEDMHSNPIIETLKALDPPLGKYWIYGNHDHGGYGTEIIHSIMERAGFTLLKNSHVEIKEQNKSIILAGIDDVMLGKPDLKATLDGAATDNFTVLLAHEPDIADQTVKFPIDVQLSGHSHGGQVRLPLIGRLYTPLHAEKYVIGKYVLDDKLQLFVNAGIGTTRMPYRLLCRPEIHEYVLQANLS